MEIKLQKKNVRHQKEEVENEHQGSTKKGSESVAG